MSPRTPRTPRRWDRDLKTGLILAGCFWVLSLKNQAPNAARAQEAPPSAPSAAPAPTSTQRAPERLNFAHRLLRDRRYDLAAEEYEAVLAAQPAPNPNETADARFGLATARWFLGQYQPAREQFERFLKEAPEHAGAPTAWFRVGETAYLLGDLPAAQKALETYTQKYSDHRYEDTAWTYLGEIHSRQGDLDEARRDYETTLKRFPDSRLVDRARYGLARLLLVQKEYDGAQAQLDAILKGGHREWLDRARLQTGLVQLAAGRPDAARAALETLEAETPQSSLLPEARLRRAEALVKLDRAADAEALLRPLAASASGVAVSASYALAAILMEQNRPADALATYDDALTRFPSTAMSPLLWYSSGEAAATAGQRDDARRRFLKVVENYPKDEWADDALLRAAELSQKLNDAARARTLAAELPNRFPNSPLCARARLVEAQAALAVQDPKAAVDLLEPLLADPQLEASLAGPIRLALSVAYRGTGQTEKAQDVLRAMEKAPPDARYLVGVGHFDAKRYVEAIPALESYLANRPQGEVAPDALALLAVAHQELGHVEEANKALDRLAAEHPASKILTQTRLRLGEAALDAKDFDRAITLLSAAVTDDTPAKARALWGLGWAQLSGGHPADAAASFASLIETAPQDPMAADAAVARARALEESGRPDEALVAYDQAATKYASHARAPAAATLAKARLLDRHGRHTEAAEVFSQYLKDHPHPPEGGEPTDTVLAEAGWALLDAEKRPDALAAFHRILDEFPNSPRAADARVALAEAAHAEGKIEEVETLLEPVVADGSKVDKTLVQDALFRLGLARFDHHGWVKAAEAFDRLLGEYPESPLAAKVRFWKAETAFQAGDPKAAEAAFAALLTDMEAKPAEGSSGSPDWLPTARLRHIESLVALERWQDALTEADALKRDFPRFPAMHELDYARGRALQGLSRFDEARETLQAVIAANRDDDYAARAQFLMGETYFHQRKFSEALKEYLRVVYNYQTPSLQAAALFEAGQVAERLDRWADAADFYQQVTSKFATDPIATKATERLAAVRARKP